MATASKTIYTHTCDLCGNVREDRELRHLYSDRQPAGSGFATMKQDKIDICEKCPDKPVSEVLVFFDKRRAEAEEAEGRPVSYRVVAEGGGQ